MRIAFINNTKIWSGVKTWSLSMAKSALEHGLEASIVGRDPAFVAKAATLGIPSQRFVVGMDYNPRAILWYYRYFIRNKVDAVVASNDGTAGGVVSDQPEDGAKVFSAEAALAARQSKIDQLDFIVM